MSKRQKKNTRLQYEELLAFVESNKVLLHGKTKPLEAHNIKNLWQTFADKINSSAVGPMKSADQWKKIFVEWKVNIKRKSRLIHEEVIGTGGGPKVTKPLSDIEERLLNLITKAHLGDSRLPDSLGHAETLHQERPQLLEFANFVTPSELEITFTENADEDTAELFMSPADQNSDDVFLTPLKRNVEKTPSKTLQREKQSRPNRYTNTILQDACNSFKNANDVSMQSNAMLAEALNKFTAVFEIKAEADMLRAKAEMAKAKCLHFQTFGNLDEFE